MTKESSFGSCASETVDYRSQPFELDTLELTRRGRQEQARVIGELFSAALKRLAQWGGRQHVRRADKFVSTQTQLGLKGN